jgi:mono/diheme cytochrome c family protein
MRVYSIAALVLAATVAIAASPQTTGRRNPPLVIDSMTGQDLFGFYCATCHGRDAKGHGPVAASLKVAPADLTTIARRNNGVFPSARIAAFLTDGDARTEAHGTREMPIWGPIFMALDPSDTLTRVRINNVVSHVQTLQVP